MKSEVPNDGPDSSRTAIHPISRSFVPARSAFGAAPAPSALVALWCAGGLLLLGLLRLSAADAIGSAPAAAPAGPPILTMHRPDRTSPVDFHREILPILQPSCLPCHNRTTTKGDLNLETPALMTKGGESGPSLVPGKSADSLLLKVATHAAKPRMPPKDNKVNAGNLSPDQLGLLALWIDQGAPAGQAVDAAIAWQPVPAGFQPVYAVAVTDDGQFAAAGRGNQIHVYRTSTARFLQRLEDPALGQGAAQRDVVNALAFSPDGQWLAAGGFREVRLWHWQPPRRVTDIPIKGAVAATFSEDHSLLAVARTAGPIELVRPDDGTSIRSLALLDPAPRLLQFSERARYLAAANVRGQLRAFDVATGSTVLETDLGTQPVALAWAEGGRRLVLAGSGSPALRIFELNPTNRTDKTPTPVELAGHGAQVTVLADAAFLGAMVASGSVDGTVRLWPADPKAAPRVINVGSPVTALAILTNPARLAIATRNAGTQIWSADAEPKLVARLAGDPRLAFAADTADRQLTTVRNEADYLKGALKRADDDRKKRSEELTKVTEKHQADEKALAEKQQSLTREEGIRTASSKEKDELNAALQQSKDRHEKARKNLDTARQAAGDAAERNATSRLAADQSARTRADLERLASELVGKSDDATVARAKETAMASAKAAESKASAANEARAATDRALDDLAAGAAEAGEAKALLDRANAELPAKAKQAEERVATAGKAIDTLKPQIDRARIQRDTSEGDVQLAQRNLESAKKALSETSVAIVANDLAITNAQGIARQTAATRDAAVGRAHVWLKTTINPASLVTLDDEGRVVSWDPGTWQPGTVATLPTSVSHPVACLDGAILALGEHTLDRWPLEGTWVLARRLGTGEAGSSIVDRVGALAYSPDGRFLATGGGEPSRSGELKIWSVEDASMVRDLGGLHSDCVLSLAFSPRGDFLASGGADRFLRISDVATGKPVRHFEGHTHHVLGVAWNADGRLLASGGAEGVVKLWNRLTGERIRNVDGFGKEVTGVVRLGLAAEYLAISGAGQARAFKEDGGQLRVLPAGAAFLSALGVSADGRIAVGGGDDGVLRVWDVTEGRVRCEFPSNAGIARN